MCIAKRIDLLLLTYFPSKTFCTFKLLGSPNETIINWTKMVQRSLPSLICEQLPLRNISLIHVQYIIHFAWIYLTHDTILGVHPTIFHLPDDLLAVSKMQIKCVQGWRWVVKNKWFKRIICHVAHTKNSKKETVSVIFILLLWHHTL